MKIFFVLASVVAGTACFANDADIKISIVQAGETLIYRVAHGNVELEAKKLGAEDVASFPSGDPLEKHPFKQVLTESYLEKYLQCASKDASNPLMKEWILQQSANASEWTKKLFSTPLNEQYGIVSEARGRKGMIFSQETGRIVGNLPCGMSVKFIRVSPGRSRIAIVVERMRNVAFTQAGRLVSWGARPVGDNAVFMHEVGALNKAASMPNLAQDINDIKLPDDGEWFVLASKHTSPRKNPAELLYALAGHSDRRSEIFLRKCDSLGRTIIEQSIAFDIPMTSASFL